MKNVIDFLVAIWIKKILFDNKDACRITIFALEWPLLNAMWKYHFRIIRKICTKVHTEKSTVSFPPISTPVMFVICCFQAAYSALHGKQKQFTDFSFVHPYCLQQQWLWSIECHNICILATEKHFFKKIRT